MRWFALLVVILLLASGGCRSSEDTGESQMTIGSVAAEDADSPFRNLGKRDETGT